ncbi:TonB-dependent receptor plug domain-containing protein [Chitinophaga polysaccharea]|uniref:alpha-2-macroglobulin family protein n=1 Tax=Chitinophaga polysaccharea TaxID=1293035 RepID=UPI001455CFC1|nr:alpha-2-macroglobulin family protein [Chitinophaga polysaccharea]NLR59045.1 TonB-dependent receptor plug domain-containing protein [Chitinophaga polysaccharea]
MKRSLFLLCCLYSLLLHAQQPLTRSTTRSTHAYVYQLSDQEAREIFQWRHKKRTWAQEKYLHTLQTSYPQDNPFPATVPPGNYLVVSANKNDLAYAFQQVHNLRFKLVSNDHDLAILLHDNQGAIISNAEVQVGGHHIPWDETTHTYRLPRFRSTGTVTVRYNQVLNLFQLANNRQPRKTSWWKRLLPHHNQRTYRTRPEDADFYVTTPSETHYKGFMAFSKPKYKPNDTVRLKAFITRKDGRLVNTPLLLRLSCRTTLDTILTVIHPYRAGGYDYEFVLNDSLDLDLDDRYLITLETLASRKYALDNNETDLDDEAYAAKRTVLIRGTFEYEEYDLKSIHFSTRTDHEEHTRGMPLSLYLKATDENGLPVMDGRVTITVTPNTVRQYHAPFVFIPKTLWTHETALDMTGETKVTLPDSIFPAATFSYTIASQFLNSNNESQRSSNYIDYTYEPDDISFSKTADSISISFNRAGKVKTMPAVLRLVNGSGDTIGRLSLMLPTNVPVQPFAASYLVTAGGVSRQYSIARDEARITANNFRTHDSVFISVNNPSKLSFWYSIFADNKLVDKGYNQQLLWKAASITPRYYSVSIQYILNDQVQRENFYVPYADKQLQVSINSPLAIYPGQTSRIGVTVKDIEGRPVKGADVTAYAITSKFSGYQVPAVPYLGREYNLRRKYSQQRLNNSYRVLTTRLINWERWKNDMALDSITYYRFLYATGIYYNTAPVASGITQLAPFIRENNTIQAPAMVTIDEQPVYFDQAGQSSAYSFAVSPGKHRLELRIWDKRIIVDSIEAVGGMKTFVSIPVDEPNTRIKTEKMPTALTSAEQVIWRRYLVPFELNGPARYTYIRQGNNIYWFRGNYYRGQVVLAGPLHASEAEYVVKGNFSQTFQSEPGYAFSIRKGLVKEKEIPDQRHRPFFYVKEWLQPPFYDEVFTTQAIDTSWENEQGKTSIDHHIYPGSGDQGNGYDLQITPDTCLPEKEIRQLFLYRYDNPSFVAIYPKSSRRFTGLDPGYYRLLVLHYSNRYYVADSLEVREGGNTYYRLLGHKIVFNDSVSRALHQAILDWPSNQPTPVEQKVDFNTAFNQEYLTSKSFTRTVYGVVTDKKLHTPLTGVTVKLKGTNTGAVTDSKGFFRLPATEKGILIFSLIGYNSEEVSLKNQDYFDVGMEAREQHLLESVVVVGYGTVKKSNLTASISNGREESQHFFAYNTNIRGDSTRNLPPLILIDGIPYAGDLKSLLPDQIKNMTVLKDAAATALYGARAANGVIIITSSKAGALAALNNEEGLPAGNSIRTHFRDDAFWQPRLRTNEKGEASFKVIFPDDITSWKTYALAYTDQRQTGAAEAQIKSFKPLSANLSLPTFAIAGDSIRIIGKILNYGRDSSTVSRAFYANHRLLEQDNIGVQNSYIDTFPITVPMSDSASFQYSIHTNGDYFDGEYRAIPVMPAGVKETNGFFAALPADTTFTFAARDTGVIHVYANTSLLPVLLEETDYLERYEYLCNEQMASKLTGLLLEKQGRQLLRQPFDKDRKIRQLISDLQGNRNKDGNWGWWHKGTTEYWISQHVIQAFLMAERQGFSVNLDKTSLINYQVFLLNSAAYTDKITLLETLHMLGAKLNFPDYLDTLKAPKNNLYDQYRLLYLKQRMGMTVKTDSLLARRQTTMMGNSYWGEENYQFFNNSVQITLLAYKILKAAGGQEPLLHSIRNWFLEKRHGGNWRNTYESASILATIMPDVLEAGEQHPATLQINGQAVTQFPYNHTLPGSQSLQVSKGGGATVYFSAWQQHWNPAPLPASHQFSVNSKFIQEGKNVAQLTAGKSVQLTVEVDVKANADYIMVEIPIPAGCSYEEKKGSWTNNEVHREHFKDKVSIFCNQLSKGRYTFQVALMPRYTGRYHLNPAKAEMMYFPIFFGRTGLTQINIAGAKK